MPGVICMLGVPSENFKIEGVRDLGHLRTRGGGGLKVAKF